MVEISVNKGFKSTTSDTTPHLPTCPNSPTQKHDLTVQSNKGISKCILANDLNLNHPQSVDARFFDRLDDSKNGPESPANNSAPINDNTSHTQERPHIKIPYDPPYQLPFKKLTEEEFNNIILKYNLPSERVHQTETWLLPSTFPLCRCPAEAMIPIMEDRLARRADEVGKERWEVMMESISRPEWEDLRKKDMELYYTLRDEIVMYLRVAAGVGRGCYAARWESGDNWIEDEIYYGSDSGEDEEYDWY